MIMAHMSHITRAGEFFRKHSFYVVGFRNNGDVNRALTHHIHRQCPAIKTEFDVKLADIGPKKINVIKEVRALTSLGLKEAKEAVDGLAVIMEGVSKEAAEEAKEKLEAAGAKVEIK